MSLFGIVFPLFIFVNLPRTIISILMIIKYRGNDQAKKDKWYLIRYKERSFTLFTQIFYLFFYLVTVGLYYQQVVDQNYSDSTNNMLATIVAFKTFAIVGDVIFELYLYLKMMSYAVGLIIAKQEAERQRREVLIRARREEEEKKETEARLRQEQEEIKRREEDRKMATEEEQKTLIRHEEEKKQKVEEDKEKLDREVRVDTHPQNSALARTNNGLHVYKIDFNRIRRDYMDRNAVIRETTGLTNQAEREELLRNARCELVKERNEDEEEVDYEIANNGGYRNFERNGKTFLLIPTNNFSPN